MRVRSWRVVAVTAIVVTATTGCAGATVNRVRIPTGNAALLLHEWSAVERLSVGTQVQVTLDTEAVDGKVASVTEKGLQVVWPTGRAALGRSSVVKVTAVESK